MGVGAGGNLGQMIRQQQQAADQRRSRGRRGMSKTSSAEAYTPVTGNAHCEACGVEDARSYMFLTASGMHCECCYDEIDTEAPAGASWWVPAALAAAAVCAAIIVPDLDESSLQALIYSTAYPILLFGPVLGPMLLLVGLSNLKQLRHLAESAAPHPYPGFASRRLRDSGTVVAGTVATACSLGAWIFLLVEPLLT